MTALQGSIQLRTVDETTASASTEVPLNRQPVVVRMDDGSWRMYRGNGSSQLQTLFASGPYLSSRFMPHPGDLEDHDGSPLDFHAFLAYDTVEARVEKVAFNQLIDDDPTLASESNSMVPTVGAVKALVDDRLAGVDWKDAVRVRTTANITLSGTQTIDGVALSVDDRVLVMNQSTATQNGLYLVQSGSWVRTTDADTGLELAWATVTVMEGTTHAGTRWVCNTAPITLGTTPINWTSFGGGTYTADETTIEQVGSQFRLKDGGTSLAKLQSMAEARVMMRAAGAGTGAPIHGTADQLQAVLDLATDPYAKRSKILEAFLPTDFTTSSNTHVDVTGLAVTIPANSRAQVSIVGAYQSPNVGTGAMVSITRTGSPTVCNFQRTLFTAAATNGQLGSVGNSDDLGAAGNSVDAINTDRHWSMTGIVVTGASPCTIQVRAVRGGAANTITIRQGSSIIAHVE